VRDVRVVVVDRSTAVRHVLCRMLRACPGITVVGEAASADEALTTVIEHRPDAVLLDLDLPKQDGLTAAAAIMSERPTPIVAMASRLRADRVRSELRQDGIGVLIKPEVPEEWEELSRVLPETLLQVGSLAMASELGESAVSPPLVPDRQLRYVAIGASTGGPGALRRLLQELGQGFTASVVVVQHIASGFETGLADWLGAELGIDVRPARHGEMLVPGAVRLAEGGSHLRVDLGGRLRLDHDTPPIRGHKPSANVLFWSLRDLCPAKVAGVLLTGMGDDGVEGLLALRQAGALTVTQDQASCAVFGMPRAALERRATEVALPPQEIGRMLASTMRGERL
jgi:two-component system chemotaxis response regulator CheB